jgi:trans-aconitate methyltransferase
LSTEPFDLVFSNAALHWTPDQTIHKRILINLVSSGGVLAVQMPDTRRQPSHLLMEEAAKNCGHSDRLVGIRIPRVEHDPDFYFDLLTEHCASIDLWSTEYTHLLPCHSPSDPPHPVAEFTSATGLQPVVNAIRGGDGASGEDRVRQFLKEYNRLLLAAYPPTATVNGTAAAMVLFPFKRFFFVAKKLSAS